MATDWKLCLDWLVRCQVLPENHAAKQPSAQVFDLAQSLRDGVHLCHLLNRLCPGILPPKEFSQRPQMSQFLCQKNIAIFLQLCTSAFNLKETDLFTVSDLYEIKDFGKVIETLSKLSRSPLAQRQNIPGFSLKQASSVHSKDDVYGDLSMMANEQDVTEEYYDIIYTDGDKDEEIYEDVMNVQHKYSTDRPFAIEPKSKREHVLKELYETERNYVEALNMIIKHFINPLKSKLDPRSLKTIFEGVEELHECHKNFLSDLLKAVMGHTVGNVQISIADCFIKSKESFLIYGEFCSHLPVAQEHVDQVCLDPVIRDAVQECQLKANEGRFRLRDLLSVPMQRVLKYHLLIHELIKQTDMSHPDKKSLPVALAEMQDLSSYINEVKRDNEMNENLRRIQESITDLQMPEGTTLINYGRLQKDGELRVKSHDDNRFKTRYVFLFDKVVLMCKALTHGTGAGYSYKSALILSQYRIDDVKKTRDNTSFSLVENGERNVYTFSASTAELKQKWIDSVKMAMDNVFPAGAKGPKHEFVMLTLSSASICDVCKKLLRGVFYQGYKCIKPDCNMKVHKECITRAKDMDGVLVPELLPPKPTSITRTPSVFQVPPAAVPSRSSSTVAKCKAKFSYGGKPPPENGRSVISFEVNDVIDLINCDDPNWWEGRINGRHGFFPSSYVEVTRSMIKKAASYEDAAPRMSLFGAESTPPAPGPRQSMMGAEPHRRPSNASVTSVGSPEASASRASLVSVGSASSDSSSNNGNSRSEDLTNCQWFVGKMSREDAQKNLDTLLPGTYLIRESVGGTRQGEYALSIRSSTGVRHIKINKSAENRYFAAECRHFKTISELVEYYQQNSLKHSFPELDTTLSIAYKDVKKGGGGVVLGYCIALYDYAANQAQILSLRAGDRIAILSKGTAGWWKGDLDGKKGYFPCTYVVEVAEE